MTNNAVWYLGIDFGTTGVSAVLLNYSSGQRYPIYWLRELPTRSSQGSTSSSDKAIFRLPAVTYSGLGARELFVQLPGKSGVASSLTSKITSNQPGIFLQHFKPYLNITIPYYSPQTREWEPKLQLHSQQQVTLYGVRRAFQALLTKLTPKAAQPESDITVGAVGLKPELLKNALGKLEGVIIGSPAAWGDTYRLNLREALLSAKLVKQPEQIFFLEDAIAPILAGITSFNADPQNQGTTDKNPPTTWQDGTLVLNAGATTTELALVNLPEDLENLTYNDFGVLSWHYAGSAIEQDIFCQLLYPQLSQEQKQQLALPDDLELPLPAQPEQLKRDRLTLVLHSSPLGQALLKASGYLKLILQQKAEFTLNLSSHEWLVKRQDLETKVLKPFLKELNRQLNTLLVKTGISEQGIYQVFCIGGTAGFKLLSKWLQAKFPNASLIQDSDSPTGSWVATGLATLPLYPQVLNRNQHQYNDYFLLLELLRAFPQTKSDDSRRLRNQVARQGGNKILTFSQKPGFLTDKDSTSSLVDRPYSIQEIMQRLERRGLNTRVCYERLVRLLEGELPDGLVPSTDHTNLLAIASQQNPHYLQVAATGLFSEEENQLYHLNLQQQKRLWEYLDLILSGTYQQFEEPTIVKFRI
ncbi:MAG: hypothetical protein F6K14_01540 [Symploca sp. SIO2C1]|nr:hypothetical protein [Symploca sp. SIO2C1]